MGLKKEQMHTYQKGGVDWIIKNLHAGLFMDMGLGKTVTSLTAIKELIDDLDITKTLIVAPKRVAESVWHVEIEKWEHLKNLKISKIIGNEKQRQAALKAKADIYIISRDNIAWLCGQYGGLMLPFDFLIVDESSSFKNPKSVRFKALKKVQPSFRRVVILTGTPASNGLIDLWPQMYLLDRGERLGKTITSYRDTYFKPGRRNGAIVFNYTCTNEQLIHDKINDICMSLSSKDYLDMPDAIINDINIKFSPDLQAKYDDFEERKVLEILNSEEGLSVTSAAVLSNKLLQFSNGAVYDEEKNAHLVHDLKLDVLEEIIESANGKPVLVAYAFKSDIDRIMTRFKSLKPVLLKTDKDVLEWNAGKIQLMLIHPASAGHGLNLQNGGHILAWFGLPWSLELYLQTNTRLDRQGQKELVIINRIICESTIEQRQVAALVSKNKTQAELLNAVKLIIKKYEKLKS
jgi:SNF2 family DNA or RNA helicase